MKNNLIKVKKFQKPLMCLVGIWLIVFGIVIDRFISANADEINYEYESNSIDYDNSNSNLNATNVKNAIDELYEKLGKCPKGQFCYSSEEIRGISGGNILRAYVYDETEDSSTFCVNGEEDSCIKSTCYNNLASGSCPVGTVIDYFVNNSTIIRFHVLHDNGNTMTMQTQRNTLYNIAWQTSGENRDGPVMIMAALKTATNGWSNVNDITLADGMTEFNDGTSANNKCDATSCSPSDNDSGYSYSMLVNNEVVGSKVKARLITLTETVALGCTIDNRTCPIYLYNYLYDSESNCRVSGKCTNDIYTENGGSYNYGYWTMSANWSSTDYAWRVLYYGRVGNDFITSTNYGARAVVVVNK